MVYHSSAIAFQHHPISGLRTVEVPPAIPAIAVAATSTIPSSIPTRSSFPIFDRRRRCPSWLASKRREFDDDEDNSIDDDVDPRNPNEGNERDLLLQELARVESLEDILAELEEFGVHGEDDDDFLADFEGWDEESLEEFFRSLPADDDFEEEEEDDDDDDDEEEDDETYLEMTRKRQSTSLLENALLQGVVAPSAGVGSNCLPGDFNFDPLDLASKDYFPPAQAFFRNLIPAREEDSELKQSETNPKPRPRALVLRDYREAEIRHGRLAMLAATFWPLQELLDRLVLDDDKFNSLLNSLFYGGVTLPYFPLLMTAIMLLLGYLDIYSQTIKDVDKLGDAFLPGDCFWDPLQILTGAPDSMKRNMQERELFNGRFAMLAFAVFLFEEARTGKPVISIPGNEILFEPAYQVPFVQKWLDSQFSTPEPVFYRYPEEDIIETITSVEFFASKICDSFTIHI